MNKYLSIITLIVNGLSAPIKRHRVAEWIRNMTHTYTAYKRPTSEQKTYRDWKWKAGNKYSKKMERKKSQGSNSCIRQNRLQNKAIKRDTEGHLIILKGRIHQKDINIIITYAPNIGVPKYIRKILEDFKKI